MSTSISASCSDLPRASRGRVCATGTMTTSCRTGGSIAECVGDRGTGLAGQAHDLRRKSQAHVSPDRVDDALRLRERGRTRIAWCNKELLPGIDAAALGDPGGLQSWQQGVPSALDRSVKVHAIARGHAMPECSVHTCPCQAARSALTTCVASIETKARQNRDSTIDFRGWFPPTADTASTGDLP
jgi:hypothetical protein